MRKRLTHNIITALSTLALAAAITGCQSTGTGDTGKNTSPETTTATAEQTDKDAENTTGSADSDKAADIILKNGHIQTLVNENDTAQAVGIKGNEIIYVGDDAGVEEYAGSSTQIIDLEGKFVSPGFMDGHIHGVDGMLLKLFQIDLTEYKTNEEYLTAIKSFVEAHPDMNAYYGSPFMLNVYQQSDGSNPGPKKEDLDAISPDKPIIIYDVSYHSMWTNSAGLAAAGINADTPNPKGGVIARDENGEATGYLTDAAKQMVEAAVPPMEYSDDMYKQAMLAFQEEANSRGITGITDLNVGPSAELLRKMEADNELTLRLREVYTLNTNMSTEDLIKKIQDVAAGNTDMVRGGTVKIFYDGVTESATAVMLEPYLEEAGHGDAWYGEPVWDNEEFQKAVIAMDAAGIQVHVHAIGSGAVNKTLDAFEAAREANGKRDTRHTMTHVCAITDEDIQRMKDLDIIGALQFLWMYGDPLYELEAAFIGEERALAMYPTKTMAEAGVLIAGASDAPVTDYDTREEIEVGVTRNSPYPGEEDTDMHRWPEQALTPYQMLEIYSKNVAYENFMDSEIGTVEVGKKADLVVLGQNILTCSSKEISDVEVVYTISNGRIVYSNK